MTEGGVVQKRGKWFQRWKSRWFVKEGDFIISYPSQKSTKPKTKFDLHEWTISLIAENKKKNAKKKSKKEVFQFEIKNELSKEKYLLRAKSEMEMEKWLTISKLQFIKNKYGADTKRIARVQAVIKGRRARIYYQKLKQGVLAIQTWARRAQEAIQYKGLSRSVQIVQAIILSNRQQRDYNQLKFQAETVQSLIRRALNRKEFEQKISAAEKIQAILRRNIEVRARVKLDRSTILLQTLARSITSRAQVKFTKRTIIKVQSAARRNKARKFYKQAVQRKRIATELMTTEQTYVNNLALVVEIFMAPLQDSCRNENPILAPSEIFDIFVNWEVILHVNSVFLKRIEERVNNWKLAQQVGDIFCSEEFEALSVYENFVIRFHDIIAFLDLKKKSHVFNDFLTKANQNPKLKKLTLESFLIQPVQRLPRYELLLRDLVKNTPKTHEDYQNLTNGLENVKKVNSGINERQREIDTAKQAVILMQKLGHYFTENKLQLGKDLKFVKEGEVSCNKTESFFNSEKRITHMFLFSTQIVLTTLKKDNKYEVREVILIQNIKNVEAKKNELELHTSSGPVTLSFKTSSDGKSLATVWETEMLKTITSYYV